MTVKLLSEHHLEFLSLKGAAQARLSLHLSKCHIVGNHMLRVKSGNFGHTLANSGNPDETAPYEPSHQDFHCYFSIPIIKVWNKKGRCPNLPDVRNYPTLPYNFTFKTMFILKYDAAY